MPETLEKLRPDRDLQCYFLRPSAIAAISDTSPHGFTVSGTWRQQFDWAVIEWNRDNVFEHPMFRNLPDGDFTGLTLSYEETRTNCIPIDSDLFATVAWPTLRIWADNGAGEIVYEVPLRTYATPIEGSYQPATATVQLLGTPTTGDQVGFAFLDEHYSYEYGLVEGVNVLSPTMRAALLDANTIQLIYVGTDAHGKSNDPSASNTGTNGNRVGLYTYAAGSGSAHWDVSWKQFSGGVSPSKWRITLPFASLYDPKRKETVPAHSIRRMRWTYSADLQPGAYQRSEFQVTVSNWQVTGSGRAYSVAGPGSRRIEDGDRALVYSDGWSSSKGNFSGGTIHFTNTERSSLSCSYVAGQAHSLYLGTRLAANGATIQISIDGRPGSTLSLVDTIADILIRHPIGALPAGSHRIDIQHTGTSGAYFYFDFLELAIPTTVLPVNSIEPAFTLSTDWDTDHSIALSPERTAWMIDSLGFKGRVNHYVGALWFYELARPGQQYASGTITFIDPPASSSITTVLVGQTGNEPVSITHLNLIGETSETLAKAFELKINGGYTAVWAQAVGNQLTIYSRAMGLEGENITIGVICSTQTQISGPNLSGASDGNWRTDLTAVPRVNRAARDWTRSFCAALKGYGHSAVTTALSTELQHGDPSPQAGIAQRYPSGLEVMVNTPALQTNFAPQSTDFWKQAYADLAQVQVEAGLDPYLQFGEVQWWYFAQGDGSGMPFYDQYTKDTFRAQYGRDMAVIVANTTDPSTVPGEASFLPALIGQHTDAIIAFIRGIYPNCRFEVLYPPDVNNYALNKVINYPKSAWTPDKLDCLKTESFTYTFNRNLDLAQGTIRHGEVLNFPSSKRSHLVGLEDPATAWLKEARMAEARRFDSIVLFALDQFCLMGYPLPLSKGLRRSVQMG